jgi:hypothetical protein
MSKKLSRSLPIAVVAALCLIGTRSSAQTDMDAIMLKKNIFCAGAMYSYSSWTNYWEGTFKRDNLNLGRVSTEMYAIAGNYGITDRLNFLFMAPYVKTNATAGTLHGMKGVQDLSLMLKWMAFSKRFDGNQRLSVYGVGRVSFPLTNYVVDYLPLSIGMRSKTAGLRAMVDYQRGKWFATASAAYTLRSNVTIDRTAYYDTEMHNTNEVEMPDMSGYSFRAGYRTNRWIAEGVVENMTTLGGFDIRKNDMPFPSNKMNQTQVGANVKYTMKSIKNLELTGGVRYVVAGRNVGQATTINGGIFYLMNFSGNRVNQTNIPK